MNIILWAGGTLFSLGVFAVKVGFGLGCGKFGAKGVGITLAGYVILFMLIAQLSETLIRLLEPLLRKGHYLHALMAAGMIGWGLFTIRGSHGRHQAGSGTAGAVCAPSLLLLIPCPVCVTAMTFSTWAALNVIKLPAALVGLGLGLTFGVMSLVLLAITRFRKSERPETPLGLTMIVIGLYFVTSLFLPAKIEEAKEMYSSFLTENSGSGICDGLGVLAILLAVLLIGFFARKHKESKE